MKKLILIICIALLTLSLNAQSFKTYYCNIDVSTIVGADTTVYWATQAKGPLSIILDSSTYTGSGGIFDILVAQTDSSQFSGLTHKDLPFAVTGTTQAFEKEYYSFRWIGFKFTKGSITAGYFRIYATIKY